MQHNKLKSVKNILLIWILTAISYIIIADKYEFISIAQNLSWAVLAYFGCNVAQKKIFADSEKRNES